LYASIIWVYSIPNEMWIITTFVLILVSALYMLFRYEKYEVTYVVSDVDGKEYLVRDLDDKQQAANLLARVRQNIMTLTDYLVANKTKFVDYEKYIEQLNERIRGVVINESTEKNQYTSYSVNKGEQIVFCLRSRRDLDKLHDLNIVMYVALHEVSHVGCPETDHTPLFKKIFAFFCQIAVNIGLYQKIPFREQPVEYCGLMISDSII